MTDRVDSVTHCPWCRPCCCRECDPWRWFVHFWGCLGVTLRNPEWGRKMWGP